MLKKITSFMNHYKKIKLIDFIGPQIGLELNNSTRYKSNIGGFLTAILIVSISIIAFLFGKEVYQRKIPNISEAKIAVDNNYIDVQDINLQFALFYLNGTKIDNILRYLDVSVSSFHVNIDGETSVYSDKSKKSILICEYCKSSTKDVCLKQQALFYNEIYSRNSTTIRFHFRKCSNDTILDNYDNCFDDTKIEEIFNSANIVATFNNNYLNAIKPDSNIVSYTISKEFPLSNKLSKTIRMNFLTNLLSTDKGWLLENILNTEYIELNEMSINYDFLEDKQDADSVTILLGAPRIITATKRKYMKIQDLFANIGGIFTAFSIIVKAIFYHYLNWCYLIEIDELCKNISQEKRNSSSISNNFINKKRNSNIREQNITSNNFHIDNLISRANDFTINNNKIINNDLFINQRDSGNSNFNELYYLNIPNKDSNLKLETRNIEKNDDLNNQKNEVIYNRNKHKSSANLKTSFNFLTKLNNNNCNLDDSNNILNNNIINSSNDIVTNNIKYKQKTFLDSKKYSINNNDDDNNTINNYKHSCAHIIPFVNNYNNSNNNYNKIKHNKELKNMILSSRKEIINSKTRLNLFNYRRETRYCKYLFSIFCCKYKENKYYNKHLASIKEKISLVTYCKLISV